MNSVESSDIECELAFTKQNYDPATNTVTLSGGDVRLAYLFRMFDDHTRIYVDAVTGEMIGYDESRDAAKCFSLTGQADFARPYYQTNLAKTCFSELGYTALNTLVSADNIRSDILSYINRSDAYGFYIACHGYSHPTNSSIAWLGDPIKDEAGNTTGYVWQITPDDISGNWKFVFLDACYCGNNSTWANAFNIYSTSTNRAFLGWDSDIKGANSILFSESLFPEIVDGVHSDNIRDAAVWAASQVPGSGTTPIRFIGDRTYDGFL